MGEGLTEGVKEATEESVVVNVLLSWRCWRRLSMSDAKEMLVKRMTRANKLRWNMLEEGARAECVFGCRGQMHGLAFRGNNDRQLRQSSVGKLSIVY